MSSQLQTAAADPTQKASRKLPKFVQIGFGLAILLLNGCSAQPRLPMDTVADLDLTRFMGDWHVLADIATPFDRNAVEPLETYKLAPGGVVETTYSYREGSPDGPLRERNLKGFVSRNRQRFGACRFSGPSKPNTALFISTQTTERRSSVALSAILFGSWHDPPPLILRFLQPLCRPCKP